MTLKTWESSLAQKTSTNVTSVKQVVFHRFNYSGLLTGSDTFIEVSPAVTQHPLFDHMQDNAYLKMVAESKVVQLTKSESLGKCIVNNGVFNTLDANNLTLLSPSYVSLDTKITALGELSSPVTKPTTFPQTLSLNWDDTGLLLKTNNVRGFSQYYRNGGQVKKATYTTPETNLSNSLYSNTFWTGYPNMDSTFWGQYYKELNSVGAFGTYALKTVGVYCKIIAPYENDRQVHLDHPSVYGTRRWGICIPVSDGGFMYVGGYLLGEGLDNLYSDFYFNGAYGDGWQNMCFAKTYKVAVDSNRKKLNDVSTSSLWPLSWNSKFLSSLETTVTSNDKVTEEIFSANLESFSQDHDVAVSRINGQIYKDDYLSYLASGYGVFKPLTADRLAVVTKSWSLVPNLLRFSVITQKCAGRSLKETTAYATYGKARAKACKDNNFLDLQYNQEYTNKQIENKFSLLNSLSVWVVDGAISPMGDSASVNLKSTTRICTVTVSGSRFSYSVNDAGISGEALITEDNVIAMVNAVAPCSFAGDMQKLSDALQGGDITSALAEANAQATAGTASNVSMKISDYALGAATTYEEVVKSTSVDGQIAYLATQVADYANFQTFIPKFLKELTGSSLYPAMAEKFTFA